MQCNCLKHCKQELLMLASDTLYSQVTLIAMNQGSQLSEMSKFAQELTRLYDINHSMSCRRLCHFDVTALPCRLDNRLIFKWTRSLGALRAPTSVVLTPADLR